MSAKTDTKRSMELIAPDYERIIPILEGLIKELLHVADVQIIIDIREDDL